MRSRSIVFSTFLALLLGSAPSFADQPPTPLVYDPPEEVNSGTGVTVPLVGLRPQIFLTDIFVTGEGHGKGFYVPEYVITKAVMANPRLVEALRVREWNAGQMRAMQSGPLQAAIEASLPSDGFRSLEISEVPSRSGGSPEYFDATAVLNMLDAGVLDFEGAQLVQLNGETIPVIPAKDEYNEALARAYGLARMGDGVGVANPGIQWDAPNSAFSLESSDQVLDKATAIELGNATFGKLRVRTAQEAGLMLDQRVAQSDDVYLIEFVVTFRDLPPVEQLALRVECEGPCVAWDLAPLKVLATEDREDTYGTPSVTVGPVTVGELFERKIVYKEVRPQIVAFGLRESRFSWELSDAAVSEGSHLFLAAIGVPKGSESIQFKQSTAAKTIGWFTEGRWLSSVPQAVTVQLR